LDAGRPGTPANGMGDRPVLESTLTDYYRCPHGMVRMSLLGQLSADAGYFAFGGQIAYGLLSAGYRALEPVKLYDALPDVKLQEGRLHIPFDPSEVVENLRRERYAVEPQGRRPRRQTLWQRPYYALRRFVPPSLRRSLQRAYLRDWKRVRFPRWPVDDTVDAIVESLLVLSMKSQGIERVPFIWFWPDGAPSCAIVTHDVETETGRDRCSWLMDIDESYGIKGSFQIIPEERYAVSTPFLEGIRRRAFEINVHDLNHDGLLFSSRPEFLRRAKRINQYAREYGARGFRSGGLYRQADWYDELEFAYDMSIPNAGHLEIQRGGCCTVMPFFVGQVVELPLTTTQDYSLFHVLRDFSHDVWKNQIEAVMSRHGLMSFIAHPDYLGNASTERAYRALLDHLAHLRDAKSCWLPLPGDVERWWRARSRMTLVPEGDGWRVEGDGHERARIAYAELDGEGLVYRLEPKSLPRAGAVAS
jgi:hypothetical protein